MKAETRRQFIKKSGKIAGGVVVATAGLSHAESYLQQETQKVNPEFRTLGKTDLSVTTIGYGAMRTTDAAMLEHALDHGINFVDTANVYQGGNNEAMVGKVLKKRRQDVILCTKLKPASKQNLIKEFEKSLTRLQTDYVDILYAHSMKSIEDTENETIRTLFAKWKQEGKIKHIGFSTHKNEAEIVSYAANDKFWDVILVAYNFQKEETLTTAIDKAAAAGIGIVAMKTQAGGYETKEMGGLSPHQASLKWVLQHPAVATTIPSMSTFEQVDENIQVMGKKMGWNDRKILHRYGQSIETRYCRSCNSCEETCPNGVIIPEVNRCFMYADGYNDLNLARENYRNLADSENAAACEECDRCVATCKYGIDLAHRMPMMNRLLA